MIRQAGQPVEILQAEDDPIRRPCGIERPLVREERQDGRFARRRRRAERVDRSGDQQDQRCAHRRSHHAALNRALRSERPRGSGSGARRILPAELDDQDREAADEPGRRRATRIAPEEPDPGARRPPRSRRRMSSRPRESRLPAASQAIASSATTIQAIRIRPRTSTRWT